MKENRELNLRIVHQLGEVNRRTGEFVAGILYGSINVEDQLKFATRLADLALAIKERATGQVNRQSVINEGKHDESAVESEPGPGAGPNSDTPDAGTMEAGDSLSE